MPSHRALKLFGLILAANISFSVWAIATGGDEDHAGELFGVPINLWPLAWFSALAVVLFVAPVARRLADLMVNFSKGGAR